MSSPARRSPNPPSRRQREARAYRLTLATGGLAVATLVVLVLSIVGIVGFGLVVLLGVLTAVLALLTKRAVS